MSAIHANHSHPTIIPSLSTVSTSHKPCSHVCLFCEPLRLTRVILAIMGLDSDCLNIGYTAKDSGFPPPPESIKSQ